MEQACIFLQSVIVNVASFLIYLQTRGYQIQEEEKEKEKEEEKEEKRRRDDILKHNLFTTP